MAIPGDYLVRLTVNGRHLEQPLRLLADPRVNVSTAALQQQLDLASTVAGLLTRSSTALLEAQSQQAQLQAITASGPAGEAVRDFAARLSGLLQEEHTTAGQPETGKAEGRLLLPEVQARLSTLYPEVTAGVAAPTVAAIAAAHAAGQDVERLEQQWTQLQSTLPALNKTLHAAGLATIHTGMAPPRDLNVADED